MIKRRITMLWTRIGLACLLLFMQAQVFADNLFATGWGRTFDTSPEGQLFFTMMELFGMWTCWKSLMLMYRYAHHQQTKHGYSTCMMIFLFGCLAYFMHGTLNVIYNSFHI